MISGYVPNFELINKILNGEEFNLSELTEEEAETVMEIITSFNILVKNNMVNIVNTIGASLVGGLPPLTRFILTYNQIISKIKDPQEVESFKQIDFVKNLVIQQNEELNYPVHIPKYNLRHYGMICHFNSCLNILSSLTGLISELNKLFEANKLNKPANLIYRHLMNSLSYVDLNPLLSEQIIKILHINPNIIDEATETMKKLLEPLYQSGVSLSNVFFWDSTDKFYKTKETNHTLSQKLSELKPLYFLCSVHDFNSVYDIDDQHVNLESFDILDENNQVEASYNLTSFIIFNCGHYVSAFMIPNSDPSALSIKNDISNRYNEEIQPYDRAFTLRNQHTIDFYIKVN